MFLKWNNANLSGGKLSDVNDESFMFSGEPASDGRTGILLFEVDNHDEEMGSGFFDVEMESCASGVEHNPTFLVDVKEMKQTRTKGGAPTKPILDLLLHRCYHRSDPDKKQMFRCIVDDCGYTMVNRGVHWAIRHTTECERLDTALKKHASGEAALLAPSNRLREANLGHEMMVDGSKCAELGESKDGEESTPDSFKAFKVKGSKQRQAAADLAVVKLKE